jgi:hypothetical protein
MLALSRTERRAVGAVALAAFVAAFAFVPGQAVDRSAPIPAPSAAPQREPHDPIAVLPRRDPFAPRFAEAGAAATAAPIPRLAPLPPNARAGSFPFAVAAPASIHLLAVVSGPQPGAIVDDRGASRFVVRGDRLSGARIAAIDAGGVVLDDGRRIALTPADVEDRR